MGPRVRALKRLGFVELKDLRQQTSELFHFVSRVADLQIPEFELDPRRFKCNKVSDPAVTSGLHYRPVLNPRRGQDLGKNSGVSLGKLSVFVVNLCEFSDYFQGKVPCKRQRSSFQNGTRQNK